MTVDSMELDSVVSSNDNLIPLFMFRRKLLAYRMGRQEVINRINYSTTLLICITLIGVTERDSSFQTVFEFSSDVEFCL